MDYISLFIISFVVTLSGALAPGPLLAITIQESARKGFKAGPLIILGHVLLEIIMLIFIIFGFIRFINTPLILRIISLSGGFILIWLGAKMLASLPRISLEFTDNYKKSSTLPLLGITMSLANPYWTIWWLTIGLGLILSAKKTGMMGIPVFFTGHISADFCWYSIISYLISKEKKFFSLKVYKNIIFVCAFSLIGFGIWFGLFFFNTSENAWF